MAAQEGRAGPVVDQRERRDWLTSCSRTARGDPGFVIMGEKGLRRNSFGIHFQVNAPVEIQSNRVNGVAEARWLLPGCKKAT